MSCGVSHGHGSYPTLLWLWYRPAAVAPIQPLAWEFPHAARVALKSKKKKKKERKKETEKIRKDNHKQEKRWPRAIPQRALG